MKKLLSLLLVLALLVGYLPAGALAAEPAYYVAGTAELCGGAWQCDNANNKMELIADGLYEKTYAEVPAGDHEFKITDGTWTNSWGKNGGNANFTFSTAKVQEVKITFNADSKEIKVYLDGEALEEPVVEAGYYVAGTGALCGKDWDPSYAANKMTLNENGLYEKTYEKVPAGTYEFKVTDGTWDNAWPGSNYSFTLTEEKNVTITFSADTKEVSIVLTDVIVEELYTVAGTGDLCGSEWNPGDLNNKLGLNQNGLYEIIYLSVPAGTHQFKVTDGTWSNSWGKDGGSDNYEFTTATECNVTITFNADTKEITVTTVEVKPYYVAGTDGLCGVGWNPGYAENKMFLDADGLYKKTFQNVQAGTHECKVTDGTWNNSWGKDGGNYVFTTEAAHDVTIVFNPVSLEISLSLADPTEPALPPEPVEYDITINVHYYRPDGDYSGWEVHMWNGVESLSATRKFAEELVEHDGKQWAVTTYYADASDTWVGFIIKTPSWTKDPDGDRHIDISDVTGGTVNVYAVTGSALNDFVTDKSEATLGAKVTAAVYDYKTSTITVTTSYPLDEVTVDTFTLEGPDGQMTISAIEVIDDYNYKLTYEGTIDEMNVYTLYFNEVPCVVTIPNTYSTEDFEAEFTYEGDDLGATWTKDATTFRLWAPTAAKVVVNLYDAGNDGSKIAEHEMTLDVNGTWIVTVEGDLNGVYYTYSVTRKGETVEAVDPYARTTGVNGNRAMVVDLDSTDPDGWENDTYVTQENYTDAVIWELHVRDFSIDASSGVSEANRGNYLAFTERGTTVPDTDISTGVDYMVDLGVNYVHLLPVYDINSVDETTDGYNWGYDPKNYNVPEGSYSSDPYNGAVRVTEFKQMVQSLHSAGIGVVMDVVYNHVADAGQFCFNQIVPGYFSRIHDDGSYQSNSGCGNDTASERSMVRKYIVDSVLYWAEEYHIDGFRWDLVGLIDYETINAVMAEVHAVNPDIIFYGEGWEMCSWTTKDEGAYASDPYSKKMTIQPNDKLVNTEAGVFAFFNDTIRNAIHGGVFTATDKGFVCGNLSADTKQTIIDSYMAYSKWGSNSERVDTPLQTINYASCHDNYTLFDNFTVDALDLNKLALSAKNAAQVAGQAAAYNNLAAAYYITAQGVPFIHAGEEMLRSKPTTDAENNFAFDHNSYSSGDGVNSFKWGSLENALNAASYEYYKGLIAFRKAHPALRMTEQAEILAAMESLKTGSNDVIAILNKGGNGEAAEIISIFNASANVQTVTLPEGVWNVYVNKFAAGTEILAIVEGEVDVNATSAMILVKSEEEAAVENDLVIYYTNDVHTYIDKDLSYDNIAALKEATAITSAGVLLVDAGDHVQGTAYGSMDKGKTIIELMNAAGYDLATLGNHEFDYGMDGAMNVIDWAEFPYVSANFYHEKDGVVGETVLDAYKVFEIAGIKVAIIGVTTPESFTKSTPAYFQDENGNYIYGIAGGNDGQALYTAVQAAIDAASAEADIVIALAHLGDDPASQPWTSEELIANTTGLDALIDGHSHSTVPMKEVKDAAGNTVVLTQTGEYFGAIGKMTINLDTLVINTELVSACSYTDSVVAEIKNDWISEIDTKLGEVIGYTDIVFDNYDETGRLVRKQETNTGNFAADALYYLFDNMDLDVDVAIMNGGGVRNKAVTGELSYKTAKTIHTFGNVACLQTITGQQLLDALEWGAKDTPSAENGGFLHVSGITYEIHTYIPSTVQKDDKGVWIGGPTGEYRVKNVKIMQDGKWVDLDLNANYNLAGYNYTLRDLGDGFAMFDGAVNVLDYVMEDYMVLANYIKSFPVNEDGLHEIPADDVRYASVYGEGRIDVIESVATGWSGYTTWTLTADGVLTISPSGQTFNGKVNMRNYWKQNGELVLPWGAYANMITAVVVEEGVHSIGQMAFYGLPNLKTVSLPESLEEIRNYAFKNCASLVSINLENVDYIREGAFYGCAGLTEVTLADGVVVGDWAFSKSGYAYVPAA